MSHLLPWKPDLHTKDDYSGPSALAKYDDTSLRLVLKVVMRQMSLKLFHIICKSKLQTSTSAAQQRENKNSAGCEITKRATQNLRIYGLV